MPINKVLLKSNNKIYSLKNNEVKHATNMTSDTLPSPFIASASSQYNTTLLPYKAFNGNNTTANDCWATINNTVTGHNQINFGSQKLANKVYVTNRNGTDVNSSPKDFNILGSNDNVTFKVIAEIKNQTNWTQNQTREFKITNPSKYQYYRLEILSNNGATYTAIGEILYSYVSNNVELPFLTPTMQDFIDYGSDNINNFDMVQVTKRAVLSDKTEQVVDVEPYVLYDVLGDSVEVLYYTDDTAVTKADLNITANWSPIDELDGDFEVVTWTDEVAPTVTRTLEVKGVPTPKFTYSLTTKDIYKLKDIIATDLSTTYNKSNVRYLLSPNNTDWYKFNSTAFEKVTLLTNQSIKANGMTYETLQAITDTQFASWEFSNVNVGVYLEDNVRDTVISTVNPLQIQHSSPSQTTQLSETSLYILNTTARIDVDLKGLTLFGTLSDDDMSRVQYRVKLNGQPYYPIDGNFTTLSPSPQPISLTMQSNEVKINDWNTLEVEFQDYFGTTDMWSAKFMGKYAGVVFIDKNNDYYSTDMGQILKYLDFGTVLTGQVTPTYEIKLKNQFGYRVRDVVLSADTSAFSKGLLFEFSDQADFSTSANRLNIAALDDEQEFIFYVRMRSDIFTEPNGNNTFNIYVTATKDV